MLLILLICFGVFTFSACSNSVSGAESDTGLKMEVDSLRGMVYIKSTGASVVLGTNDSSAMMIERTEMPVNFTYDFSIGRHEVVCSEFNSLMKTVSGVAVECASDSLPATLLTYYDAVLFANARSKAEGFDTAYTYSTANFDSENHCVNLEGFSFHPEISAYRLPTEAEWTLVANEHWDPNKGWTADNSNYTIHKVCSAADARNDVCDMAGNAMEWVNDWLVEYSDKAVANFVGAPDGGALGVRVVKGGCYRNVASKITLYDRGDVYTVTSSTKADYVGFRLAFGSIPDAIWLDSDGATKSNRVVNLAGSSTIRSLTGSYKVNLVFRNDVTGKLSFIDYYSGNLTVVEIVNSKGAYHPDISPDGSKVAYCTGLEGVMGNSALYVSDLNASGSNLVKLDVESAAIPRWRVLENGDTVIVYVTDAQNNKVESTFLSASTWQVKFSNGKFGTPQKLFDGAFHGGISSDNTLAVTGARLLRARVAETGSTVTENARNVVWYNGEQACNASLARDGSKRTLFLDFGSNEGKSFVGEKYGVHERLFIADSTGKLLQSVKAPSGYAFDHTEWTNGDKNLVVASLTNANDAHTKLVLINAADGSIVELVEGNELWHPCLWQKLRLPWQGDVSLDLDSAGAYLSENHNIEQSRFRIKMELFWKNIDSMKVFCAGSSRMEMGLNPDLYPESGMFNFAVSGIDPSRDFYFVKNYALNHSKNLKAIALSIDLDNWRGYEDHLALVLSSGVGYAYDANHSFWKDGVPEYFIDAIENAYPAENAEVVQFSNRGGLIAPSRGWSADAVEVLGDSNFTESEMKFLNACIQELEEIVQMASKQNIYVIGIIFPQAPQYKKTGSFGLYGLKRSIAEKKIAYLDSLARANPYFVLMDENKMGNHDYTEEMAQNRDHLSYIGAAQMTTRLDSVLKTLQW